MKGTSRPTWTASTTVRSRPSGRSPSQICRTDTIPSPSGVLALSLIGVLAASFSASTAKAAAPTLTILSPSDGALVPGGDPVVVRFAVSDFTMVQPGRAGPIGGPNEGHARAFLDGQVVRLVTDLEPFSLFVPSGPHTIRMQLFADDGTPLSPDVSASVGITATQGPAAWVPSIESLP